MRIHGWTIEARKASHRYNGHGWDIVAVHDNHEPGDRPLHLGSVGPCRGSAYRYAVRMGEALDRAMAYLTRPW